jgi:hypothetical protein
LTEPHNITYHFDLKETEVSSHFSINEEDGAIVKMLDRDRPFSFPAREMYVFAQDVNDNALFLDMPKDLQWPENAAPGRVGELTSEDYDTATNGLPFNFSLDCEAPRETHRRFVAVDDQSRHVNSDRQQTFAGQTVVIEDDLSRHVCST